MNTQSSIRNLIVYWNLDGSGVQVHPVGSAKEDLPRLSWGGCNREIYSERSFEARKALVFYSGYADDYQG